MSAKAVNVFDELHEMDRADERFDTIVLDPPAFAKNKGAADARPRRIQGDQSSGVEAAETRWLSHHVQLFAQRGRSVIRRDHLGSRDRCPRVCRCRRKTHAGAGPSGAHWRPGDALHLEVLHAPKGVVNPRCAAVFTVAVAGAMNTDPPVGPNDVWTEPSSGIELVALPAGGVRHGVTGR